MLDTSGILWQGVGMETNTKTYSEAEIDAQFALAARLDGEASALLRKWDTLEKAQSPRNGRDDCSKVRAAWHAYQLASKANRDAWELARTMELLKAPSGPFCRTIGCWTDKQAEVFSAALIQARLPFQFVGRLDGTGCTLDFLIRGDDYSRACDLAQKADSLWDKEPSARVL